MARRQASLTLICAVAPELGDTEARGEPLTDGAPPPVGDPACEVDDPLLSRPTTIPPTNRPTTKRDAEHPDRS